MQYLYILLLKSLYLCQRLLFLALLPSTPAPTPTLDLIRECISQLGNTRPSQSWDALEGKDGRHIATALQPLGDWLEE